MPIAATGYNLNHVQVAPKAASPTYVDVNYATTFEATVDQSNEFLRADGGVKVTTYGSREGSGTLGFGSANLSVMGTMSGDTFSTSGLTPNIIDKLSIAGATTPPAVILVAWIPNVDGNSASDGLRITLANAKIALPSASYEQESWTEFEADMSFVDNENNVMMVIESLETAPAFTGGVIPGPTL